MPTCLERNIVLSTSYFLTALTYNMHIFVSTRIHVDTHVNISEREKRCAKMLVLNVGKHIGMSVVPFYHPLCRFEVSQNTKVGEKVK